MTNRQLKKKLRQAFENATPNRAATAMAGSSLSDEQSRKGAEKSMKPVRTSLQFRVIATLAATIAVAILIGGTLYFGIPASTPQNDGHGTQLPGYLKEEIEDAWYDKYDTSMEWSEQNSDTRYYGTYGDNFVAIFRDSMLTAIGELNVAGYTFFNPNQFDILIYRDGEFVPLDYAYNQGMVTKEDVETIANIHMNHPETPQWVKEKMEEANSATSNPTEPILPPDGKLSEEAAIEKAIYYAGLTKEQVLSTTVKEDMEKIPYHYDISLTVETKRYDLEIGMYDGGGVLDFDVEYFDPNDYDPDATEGPQAPMPAGPVTCKLTNVKDKYKIGEVWLEDKYEYGERKPEFSDSIHSTEELEAFLTEKFGTLPAKQNDPKLFRDSYVDYRDYGEDFFQENSLVVGITYENIFNTDVALKDCYRMEDGSYVISLDARYGEYAPDIIEPCSASVFFLELWGVTDNALVTVEVEFTNPAPSTT